MTPGGWCGRRIPARRPDRPTGRPDCIPHRRVRSRVRPGRRRRINDWSGRVQNEFIEDGEEVREGVAEVRIVVETADGELIAEGLTDEDGRLRDPDRRAGHLQRPARHRVASGGRHDPRGRGGHIRGGQHLPPTATRPGCSSSARTCAKRRASGASSADARQRPQAGDDHRHHVGRAVADLRHDRPFQLRPRRARHVRRADRLGVQPKLGVVAADRRRPRGGRRHGARWRGVRARRMASIAPAAARV